MKSKFKLIGLALISIGFTVLVGAVATYDIRSLRADISESHAAVSALRTVTDADMMHDALRADVLAAIVSAYDRDIDALSRALSDMSRHSARFRKDLTDAEALDLDPELRKSIQEITPALNAYIAAALETGGAASKSVTEAQAKLPMFSKAFEDLETQLAQFSAKIETLAESRNARASGDAASYSTVILAVIVAAVLILAVLSSLLIGSIVRPLNLARTVARRIAEGDLSQDIAAAGNDETAMLLGSLHAMQRDLNSTINEIRHATDTISTASGEIAAGNTDLSQRTEEQASSLEETASSMEELTSTVKQNVRTPVRPINWRCAPRRSRSRAAMWCARW